MTTTNVDRHKKIIGSTKQKVDEVFQSRIIVYQLLQNQIVKNGSDSFLFSIFLSLSISFSSLDKIGNPHTSYDFCLKQHNSIDLFKYIFYFYEMRMNENHKPTSPSYCSFILECFEYFDMYCLFLKNQNLEKFYIFLFHNALYLLDGFG